MNIKKWLKDFLTPFKIEAHYYCADLDAAQLNTAVHCAVWGNQIIDQVDFTTRIGPRQVLGLIVNKPEMLQNMSASTKAKIQKYLISKDFIWDKTFYILENDMGVKGIKTDSLTPYHKLVPAS